MEIEVSRRQFFALFARGAHGAKNPKKCRDPCWPPAGVRPCASKERWGGFRIGGAQACGMESGMGAGALRAWDAGPSAVAGALKGIGGVAARTIARPRVLTPRPAPGRRFPRRLRPICARDRWRRGSSPCGTATVLRSTSVGRRR